MKRIIPMLLVLSLLFSFASCKNSNASGINIGDTVEFGEYEQNSVEGEKDSMKWLVIDKQDDKLLVINKYAVDVRPYSDNSELESVTWETCSLRKWLNGEFFENSFSKQEKRLIRSTTIQNENNPKNATSGGNPTKDKIFVLSLDEVYKLLNSYELRMCEPTLYSYGNNTQNDWWLRTPGTQGNMACSVRLSNGEPFTPWYEASEKLYVRPTLWVSCKNNEEIKKVSDVTDKEISRVIVIGPDDSIATLAEYESVFVKKTIDDIKSWDECSFNDTRNCQIIVDGKLYMYNYSSGLIGNKGTAKITEEQKEKFDEILQKYVPVDWM